MQKSLLLAAFLLPLLVIIPISAHAQVNFPTPDVSAGTGLAISDDGTTMIIARSTQYIVYTLDTPFDMATATLTRTVTISDSNVHSTQDVILSSTNDRIYFLNGGTGNLAAFELDDSDYSHGASLGTGLPNGAGGTLSSDGNWVFIGASGIRSYQLNTPYDITSQATPDNRPHGNFDVVFSNQVPGVSISNDGTRLFVQTFTEVRQFNLSPAYHINGTIWNSPDDTFVPLETTSYRGIDFSSDGTRMYFYDSAGADAVTQYVLAAPFTLPTTAVITANDGRNLANGSSTTESAITFTVRFNEAVQEFDASDITLAGTLIDNDPTIMPTAFTTDSGNAIHTFQVDAGSTVGDVTVSIDAGAASSVSDSTGISSPIPFTATFIGTTPTVEITADVGAGDITGMDRIRFNATFSESVTGFTEDDITVTSTAPVGVHVVSGFMMDPDDDTIFSFEVLSGGTDGTITVSVPAGVATNGPNDNTASNSYIATFGMPVSVEIARNTDNIDPIGARTSFTVTFDDPVTDFELSDITVSSSTGSHVPSNLEGSGNTYTFDVLRGATDATITVSIPTKTVLAGSRINSASNTISADLELDLSLNYDLIRTEDRTFAALDIALTNSGDSIFLVDNNDMIRQFALGTNFNITTAADSGPTYDILIDEEPRSLVFSPNGEQMFLIGNQADDVLQFALTGPFDISNPTHSNVDLSFSAATTSASGLAFSRDGTHLYVIGSANNGQTPGIYDFALSTGFALNSGGPNNFVSSDPFTDQFPIDLAINDEGTIMYVLSTSGRDAGSGDMRHLDAFTFGVAYDVRTLTFEATQPLVTYPTRGMAFSPDFSRLYVVGATTNQIAEFRTNDPPELVPMIYRVTEDDDVSTHSITATDADGDMLEYRLSNHPSWLTINSATGQLMGTVPQDTSSSYRAADTPARCSIINGAVNFSVTVSDDGFDADASDNVHLDYTFDIFNNVRSPNAPPVATSGNILLGDTDRQLDLADHTVDADTADILTYSSLGVGTGESNIVPGTLAIDSAGLATFMLEPGVGTSVIRYAVCDGSDLETLQVTIETFAVIRGMDQTINEGQTLNSLNLTIVSDTDSQFSEVAEITGEIGVDIFLVEEFVQRMPLGTLNPGDEALNGTRQGGGSLTDDDLQRAFRISSIEELGPDDPRLAEREEQELLQLDEVFAGMRDQNDVIDPYNIIHTIPYDFVDENLAQSPPIPINYEFVREDGTTFVGNFNIVVNRTDRAPISTLPAEYVLNPGDSNTLVFLNTHFSDPDGDDITYTISNPSPGIVDLTFLGETTLIIDPVSPGIVGAELCAESQVTGVPNAVACETIVINVLDTETVQRNIFLDSEIFIRYMGGFGNVVLNADNIVINRAILFDHIIITSDLPTATGEIRINSTGATDVDNLRLPDRIVDGRVTLTERNGTISDGPTTTSTSSFYNATFTAILHGPAGITGEGFVSTTIVPLFHDTLNVHYQEVSVDAPPVRLVPENGFGPRHSTDRFEIPVYDLFEDPDNSRPGPLNVTITAQSNSGLMGEMQEDLRGDIFGRYAVITPPNDGHTGQTRFTFTVDDGVNDPVEHQLLFRFEADPTGTLPVEFPQSPVSRIYLHPGFNPFVIDLPDLIAEGNSTFADAIMVNNIRLPDDSFITATTVDGDAESVRVAPGMAPLGRETMMVDVVLSADPTEPVITNYRVAFAEGPPPQVFSGGSDDSRWKSKATFGKSYTTGLKSVDCGYSMDNTCRDVTDYHVNYLRESIETDSFHDFTLKTSAPNGLRSLGIAFGVPGIGSSLNAAEALVDVTLERDYTLNSTYRISDVTYTNENNVIGEDAGFSIHKSKCLSSDAEPECVTLNIDGVQFREQMYHAPFVIHAMDSRGYVTIHYMNDGLLISGDSLNEPPTHDLTAKLAHQRDLAQLSLTRTDKLSDIWTDQFGYTWTKNSYGTWSYVEGPKITVSPICDDPDKRVCNAFAEKLAAYNIQLEELRDSMFDGVYTKPAFDDLHETLTIQDIDGDSRERFLADNDLLWLLE